MAVYANFVERETILFYNEKKKIFFCLWKYISENSMEDFKAIILQLMNAQNEYQLKRVNRIQQQLQQQQFFLQFHKDQEEKHQQRQQMLEEKVLLQQKEQEEKLLQQQKEQQI